MFRVETSFHKNTATLRAALRRAEAGSGPLRGTTQVSTGTARVLAPFSKRGGSGQAVGERGPPPSRVFPPLPGWFLRQPYLTARSRPTLSVL